MFLHEAVAQTRINNSNCVTKFKFVVHILNDEDRIIKTFTDEDYKGSVEEIYKNWSVAERCLDYEKSISEFVMTIKIREVAE